METEKDLLKDSKKEGIKLTRNARIVLEKRYLKKDRQGNVIETPEDMFRRVAGVIASAELNYNNKADTKYWEDQFYRIMANLEFLPNTPTLLNAGRELGLLSASFVLPVEDSLESIFETLKEAAIVHKYGGGTGFSFSDIRPEKDNIASANGIAGGPVKLINIYSEATGYIRQGGVRYGCNSACLNVNHPDILKFIDAKEDPRSLTNFAISVMIDDGFMKALKENSDYDLIHPRTGYTVTRLKAKLVFDRIVEHSWKTGDPGIVFTDRINESNPTPHLGRFDSTDPCGGQLLLPYESCNLGSINLTRVLKNAGESYEINYEKLLDIIKKAVRFLDNVIDVNRFPLPRIEEMTKKTRKIGLGLMGFADMLIRLGIPYNSEQAVSLADELMAFIKEEVYKASSELAKERGVFPAFKGSIHDADSRKMRNASCITFTNTGTVSLIANCSSGIHPIFSMAFVRNILDGEKLLDVHTIFEEMARKKGVFTKEVLEELATGKKLTDIDGIPEKFKRIFVTTGDIDPTWCVKIQAAFQKHADNAISQTVNFPESATRQDIANLFLMAYELGLKGITAYRDGSRKEQVLCTGEEGLKQVREYMAGNLRP